MFRPIPPPQQPPPQPPFGTALQPLQRRVARFEEAVAGAHVTDRYQRSGVSVRRVQYEDGDWFEDRCAMQTDRLTSRPILSPYTGVLLPPFIYHDTEARPPRALLMRELLNTVNRKRDSQYEAPELSSIDYSFVRPQHMRQINRLLRHEFWPGIDMSECLQYPDYTIVALYRRLVIGCAFITPLGYVTYIAVHPDWRGCGVGTWLLYLLMRSVPDRDITLHVSPTNSAVFLYQKFCFKAEEFVLNYYTNYYAEDSPLCRHAFFMRLRR